MRYRERKSMFLILFLAMTVVVVVCVRRGSENTLSDDWPMWREIEPGRTTTGQLIEILGEPNATRPCTNNPKGNKRNLRDWINCLSLPMVYEYEEVIGMENPNFPVRTHEVHTRGRHVEYIVEDKLVAPDEKGKLELATFRNIYGLPDQIAWSKRSPFLRAIIYCEKGIAAHAGKYTVEYVIYFIPVSVQRCKGALRNEISSDNPFAGSDVIGPLDIWGEEWSREIIANSTNRWTD